jgi:hypothetical protein
MYNKHTNTKTVYTAIIENKVGVSFNTEEKRRAFIEKLKGTRQITCVTNCSYPWNPEEGIHNLTSERTDMKNINYVIGAEDEWEIER